MVGVEEGVRSPGNFTLWAGNVKLPELPKISVFFKKNSILVQ